MNNITESIIDISIMIEKDLNQVIFFLIEKTNKMAKQHSSIRFAERGMDITVDQWVLMKFIHEHPGCSQITIAENAFKDAASITRMLDLLSKKEFIERQPIENNRRQFSIYLTNKGESYVDEHIEFVQQLRDEGTAGLTDKEIKTLKSMLFRIQNNLK